MSYIKLQGFSGTSPRTGATQLQNNQAQIANNVKLQSEELRSWRKPVLQDVDIVPLTRSLYQLPDTSGDPKWLSWAGDVDVVEGPVSDLDENRIYYTGDGKPKKTNSAMAITGLGPYPNGWLYMGVPAPTSAPTLVASGGTAPTETRAYVYTYVSTFGAVKEESAPSPAQTVTCNTSGSTVTLSGFAAAPTTGYNITHIRIYRSVAGSASVNYQFVVELPYGATTYADTKTVAQLGAAITSLYYTPPPDDLEGLVAMPNGILAGFRGNEIWFSEPYIPHAWPDTYVLTVPFHIIGLGVFDQSLVVCTDKNPYLVTGAHPSSMTQTKLTITQPCVSKRSIASDAFGVLYASENGLVAIGPGVQDVVTTPLYTRDEWRQLSPSTMVGEIYNNMYLGFHSSAQGVQGIVLMRGDIPPLTNITFDAVATYFQRSTGNIYAVSELDNKLYQLDADLINNSQFEWQSKQFIMPQPTNFNCIKVHADYAYMGDVSAYNAQVAEVVAYNQALFASIGTGALGSVDDQPLNTFTVNGSPLLDIPVFGETRTIQVLVYADDQLFFEKGFTGPDPVRLPAADRKYNWEIKVVGNTPVRSITLATSINELRQVPQS